MVYLYYSIHPFERMKSIYVAIKVLQHIFISLLKGSYIIICAKFIVVIAYSEDIRMTADDGKRRFQFYV